LSFPVTISNLGIHAFAIIVGHIALRPDSWGTMQ
jgi:hypothetical protein